MAFMWRDDPVLGERVQIEVHPASPVHMISALSDRLRDDPWPNYRIVTREELHDVQLARAAADAEKAA